MFNKLLFTTLLLLLPFSLKALEKNENMTFLAQGYYMKMTSKKVYDLISTDNANLGSVSVDWQNVEGDIVLRDFEGNKVAYGKGFLVVDELNYKHPEFRFYNKNDELIGKAIPSFHWTGRCINISVYSAKHEKLFLAELRGGTNTLVFNAENTSKKARLYSSFMHPFNIEMKILDQDFLDANIDPDLFALFTILQRDAKILNKFFISMFPVLQE